MTDATRDGVARMLRPASVAVVGASGRPGSFGARTLATLRSSGFAGRIHPVNPKVDAVDGLVCRPRLADVPEPCDLVLVLVPAVAVPAVIANCAATGAGAAVVFSSGFGELGAEGAALQEEIVATARAGGVRLLGPNCQGLLYTPHQLVASFSAAVKANRPDDRGVAYVGQSGALGGSFLGLARDRGLALTAWITTGNQPDLTVTEVAAGLVEDPAVRVLALYLEELPDGAAWHAVTRRAAVTGTAVVVLRSGRSVAGRRAAAAHTGALVGSDAAFDLTCTRNGVMVVDDIGTLLAVAQECAAPRPRRGKRVAVVTSSGGAGGLIADTLDRHGLRLADLSDATTRELAGLVPAFGSTANPVDVTAQLFNARGGSFGQVCKTLVADDGVEALAVVLTNVVGDEAAAVAAEVADAADGTDVPVMVTWLTSVADTSEARRVLNARGVGLVDSIGELCRVLAALQVAPAGEPGAIAPPLTTLVNDAALAALHSSPGELLDALGIPRPRAALATSAAEAGRIAGELAAPIVAKIVSPDIAHKTEVGGVRLGITSADAAASFEQIVADVRAARPDARIDGVVLEETAPAGYELLVGLQGAERGYPPVLTVGRGGTATEVHPDVVTTLAPVTPGAALALLRRLRTWPLLAGHRGADPLDVEAAAAVISVLSELVVAAGPDLVELEINPLIVHRDGVAALDLLRTPGEAP